MQLSEEKDQWVLRLSNARINYIHIDFRLVLDIVDDSEKATITIETPCTLRAADSKALLTPEEPSTLAPILAFFGANVLKITMQKNGHLVIEFIDGHYLEVGPDEAHEAWQVGLAHHLLVCSPGGSVSVFRQ